MLFRLPRYFPITFYNSILVVANTVVGNCCCLALSRTARAFLLIQHNDNHNHLLYVLRYDNDLLMYYMCVLCSLLSCVFNVNVVVM